MCSPRAYSCPSLVQAIQALIALYLGTFRVLKNNWLWKLKPKKLLRSPTKSLTGVDKKELSQFGYSQDAGGPLPCNAIVTPLSQTCWVWPLWPNIKTHLQHLSGKTRLGFQRSKQPTEGETPENRSVSPRGETKRGTSTWHKHQKKI